MTTEIQSSPNYVFLIGVQTDVGRSRKHNEDFVGYHRPKDPQQQAAYGTLMVVCDGVGGAAAGEIASETAVRKIIDAYYSLPAKMTVQDRLAEAIQQANEVIYELNQQRDREMATTVVAAVILDKHLVVAHAGDSRAYLVRGGKIAQLTEDHSWVEEMVRSGDLTPEEARRHPWRNRITRGLGMNPNVKVEINIYEWLPGDTLVLCSDGLTRHVSDDEIAAMVMQYLPREAVKRLIDLANQRGGKDNISVIVARSVPETLLAGAAMPEEETEPTFVPPPQTEKAPLSKTNLRQNKIVLLSLAILVTLMCLGGSGVALVKIFHGESTPSPTVIAGQPTHQLSSTTPAPVPGSISTTAVGFSTPTNVAHETQAPIATTPAPTATSTFTPTPSPSPTSAPTITPTPNPSSPLVPTPQDVAIVVPQIGAKLRSSGDQTGEELGYLKLGDSVQLLESCEFTEQAWCQVKATIGGEEKEGWIRGDLLVRPRFAVSAGSDGAVMQLSLPESLTGWNVRFLPDGELLLAAAHNVFKTPLLFRIPVSDAVKDDFQLLDGDQVIVLGFPNLTEFNPDGFTIHQATLAPNGSRFGLLQEGGTSILVWDVATREKRPKCAMNQPVLAFSFGPNGGRVACSGSAQETILEAVNKDEHWSSPEKQSLVDLAVALRQSEKDKFNVVAGVAQAGDAYYVYRSLGPNVLTLLNQPIQADQVSVDAFSVISLDESADWLAIGARDAQGLKILAAHWTGGEAGFNAPGPVLDKETRQQLQGDFSAMTFSPDGKMLAAGTSAGNVVVINMTGFQTVFQRQVEGSVKALAFSPDNTYLAVLTENQLRIYHLP